MMIDDKALSELIKITNCDGDIEQLIHKALVELRKRREVAKEIYLYQKDSTNNRCINELDCEERECLIKEDNYSCVKCWQDFLSGNKRKTAECL